MKMHVKTKELNPVGKGVSLFVDQPMVQVIKDSIMNGNAMSVKYNDNVFLTSRNETK